MSDPIIISAVEFQDTWLRHQEFKANHPEDFALITTGLSDLDIALGGGAERGQFWVVGGPPKGGKTTELLTHAKHMAIRYNVLFLTIEMNINQVGNIIFASESAVERSTIRAMKIKGDEWDRLYAAGERIGKLNLNFIKSMDMYDVSNILKAIDVFEQSTGEQLQVLVLDYLQLLESDEKNQTIALSKDVTRLKWRTIWPGRELLILAGSTINRESVRGKKWDMNSLYGSGAMERYGDIVTIIHDIPDPGNGDRPYTNRKGIDIVASRETANAELVVGYNPRTALLCRFDPPTVDLDRFAR